MMFDFIRDTQLDIMLLLCGMAAVMALLLFFTRFLSKSRKEILILMELTAFFLLWFDRLAYVYSGDISSKGYIMVRVSNFLVFFLTSAMVFGFNLYLTDWLMHEGGLKTPPPILRIVLLASVAWMVLSVVSAFTDLYYYFDEFNVYHRGNGFLISYIVPVLGPLAQLVVILKNRKVFSKLIFTSMVLFVTGPVAFGVLQVFIYGLSLVNMSMVLVSISLYIFTYLDINDTVEHAHEIEIENMQGEKFRMQKLFDQTARAFVKAVDKKDEFTEGYSTRVADYAKRIAEMSGMDGDECNDVYYAALLHDVGKIGIPDSVIQKEEDPEETDAEIMHKKPVIGGDILSSITEYPYLSIGARYSHEKYNGTGYPNGLKGEEIPEIARIISVADAFVSMSSKQRYREELPDFAIREAFVEGNGESFDPRYSDIMLKIIDRESAERDTSDESIESGINCSEYRDSITRGIRVQDEIINISFDCTSEKETESGFSGPSIIIFDSYDRAVHDNRKAIDAYGYVEYGEFWFDEHSILTGAKKSQEDIIKNETSDRNKKTGSYGIEACRYADHLRLTLTAPGFEKKMIVALPDSTKFSYIAITGEHCKIDDITVVKTGKTVGAGEIPRINDEVSYIDRIESDLKNVQIDRVRSAYTDGVKLHDRTRLLFHSMTLPEATLVWNSPYIVLYTSEDGRVGGKGYREYALIKLYGETDDTDEYADNSLTMKKTAKFPGWERWKELNKRGLEYEVRFERKNDRIVTTSETLGVFIENVTVIKESPGPVYVSITGDQCAITDIRIR